MTRDLDGKRQPVAEVEALAFLGMRILPSDHPALQLLHFDIGSDFMRSLTMEIKRSGSQPSAQGPTDGKVVDWMEKVSEDQYRAASTAEQEITGS
jgi:hypothetical protein